jgi:hypothetical protein
MSQELEGGLLLALSVQKRNAPCGFRWEIEWHRIALVIQQRFGGGSRQCSCLNKVLVTVLVVERVGGGAIGGGALG